MEFRQTSRNLLAKPDMSALPARVLTAIEAREWANEVLSRLIQLGIILLFCLIYFISPKTGPAGAFSPVPYVLLAYLVVTLVGLTWAFIAKPPDWSVYLSILFDFLLLYGLMVSFHLQYEQPASFILKAPSLLYVFIFIAIRALRFDPKFVLAAGMAAALGWALLILYVTRIDPADNMLTRSYVTYLTSNSILIGAEVDKILSILFVTAILALAVNGSRNLLVTAIAEQSAAADLSRFFDSSVASGIRTSAKPLKAGRGERREAAILNIDIRGFTRMAEQLEPSQVMRFLSAYQRRIVPIVQAHGGVIDKFMGDGILATFGTVGDSDSPAADALRTAEAILDDRAKWIGEEDIAMHGPVSIGMGIAAGTVSFGAVGGNGRLEMTVIGPAVNLSAKLEKHNKAVGSQCLVDGKTWKLARAQGYDGRLKAKTIEAAVDGTGRSMKVVALSLPAPRRPAAG